jgi:hypothetical protein
MWICYSFLLWGCLHAVAARPEVELITEPRPGEEFVLFRASVGPGSSGRNLNFSVVSTTAKPVTEEIPDTTDFTTLQTEAAETNAPLARVHLKSCSPWGSF